MQINNLISDFCLPGFSRKYLVPLGVMVALGSAEISAAPETKPELKNGTKIYEVSPAGKVRYDKPHKEVKNGKIYEVSPTGKIRYDKSSHIIKP